MQCIFNERRYYQVDVCCPSARSALSSKENNLYYRKPYYSPRIVFNTKIMVFIIRSHYVIIISSSQDESLLVGVNLLSMVMLFNTHSLLLLIMIPININLEVGHKIRCLLHVISFSFVCQICWLREGICLASTVSWYLIRKKDLFSFIFYYLVIFIYYS